MIIQSCIVAQSLHPTIIDSEGPISERAAVVFTRHLQARGSELYTSTNFLSSFYDKVSIEGNIYLSQVGYFDCTNSEYKAGGTIYLPYRAHTFLHNCTLQAPSIQYLDDIDPCALKKTKSTEMSEYCDFGIERGMSLQDAEAALASQEPSRPIPLFAKINASLARPDDTAIGDKVMIDDFYHSVSDVLKKRPTYHYSENGFSYSSESLDTVKVHWEHPYSFEITMNNVFVGAAGIISFFNDKPLRSYPLHLELGCSTVVSMESVYFNTHNVTFNGSNILARDNVIMSRLKQFTCIDSSIAADILYLPKKENVVMENCDLSDVRTVLYFDKVPYCHENGSYLARFYTTEDGQAHTETLGADMLHNPHDAIYCGVDVELLSQTL